ncbi:uncharacterized protein LOC127123605 [Lathyrus oleraceus]|uniref:uncharacterized protein LOC127123605 n=1 Tax=Pisum sativum TaxID=3888 RepID=UPI0021CE1568|nr:uncharacterized protein LOC127123605 [Pisum sativum]
MDFSKAHKMRFGTYMLVKEAGDWWINTHQVLDAATEVVTWDVFRMEFMRKYFTKDVRGKKEIEFLELKQGSFSVTEYVARFVELANSTLITCDELGHRVSECKSDVKKCYKCEKSRHLGVDYKENMVTCYNYVEPGHINTRCSKPKQASTGGKVFALTGTQTSSDDRLIRGICYINNTPLIAIIDNGASHSFIIVVCVKRLGLVVSSMSGEMVIETPAKGLKDFGIDLICLPLENLDVILGMNWVDLNHVDINCYNKSVRFLTPNEEEGAGFLSTRELKELLEKEAWVFVLFVALSAKSQAVIDELQVVHDFPEVFPDDISDVPPES